MKKGVLFIFGVFIILMALNQILALSVGDSIPIQIQTTDTPGNIITGTFNFTINISNSSTCSPVLYSNITTKTTDARGIVSYNLENVSLEFDEQYWFCYYRDSVLKQTTKIARTPYAFRAKNITLSGIEVDSNFNLGGYNFTTLGNVGIGTASPSSGLHISSPSYQDHILIDREGNGSYITQSAFSTLIEAYGSTNALDIFGGVMEIGTDGKVGIGTTNPSQKLDVVGAIQLGDNTGSGEAGTMRWTGTEFQAYNGTNWNTFGATGGGSLWSLSGSDIYYNNGKVGIGTSSPEGLLTLSKESAPNLQMVTAGSGNYILGKRSGGTIASPTALSAGSTMIYLMGAGYGDSEFNTAGWIAIRASETFNDSSSPGYMMFSTTPSGANLSTERMRITASGNVGIGTTSPGKMLHINGTNQIGLRIEGTDVSASDIQVGFRSPSKFYSVGLNTGGIGADKFTIFDQDVGVSRFVIDTDGKVGIGTTSPTTKFQTIGTISSNSTSPAFLLIESDGSADEKKWQTTATGEQLKFRIQSDDGATNTNWLEVDRTGTTVDQVVFPNGNVGIGTATPDEKLQIDASSASQKISIKQDATHEFLAWWVYNAVPNNSYMNLITFGDNNDIRLAAKNIILQPAPTTGNVGIGTTSPATMFHVEGDQVIGYFRSTAAGNSTGISIKQGPGDAGSYINLGDDADANIGQIYYDHTTNKLSFRANVSTRMTIDADGNVGIGTTSPDEKLTVKGSIGIQDDSGTHVARISAAADVFYFSPQPPSTGNSIVGFFRETNTTGQKSVRFFKGDSTYTIHGQIGVDGMDSYFQIGGGNVGIGTSSPGANLHILGSTGIRFKNSTSASSEGYIYPAGDTGGLIFKTDSGITGANNSFIFRTYNAGYDDRVVIQADGKVGIGVTDPHSALEVVGAISSTMGSITASSDAVDVSGINSLQVVTTDGSVVIGGLAGGVTGQIIHIFKVTGANNMIIEHNEGTGTQKFITAASGDLTFAGYGGITAVFNGASWFVINE